MSMYWSLSGRVHGQEKCQRGRSKFTSGKSSENNGDGDIGPIKSILWKIISSAIGTGIRVDSVRVVRKQTSLYPPYLDVIMRKILTWVGTSYCNQHVGCFKLLMTETRVLGD